MGEGARERTGRTVKDRTARITNAENRRGARGELADQENLEPMRGDRPPRVATSCYSFRAALKIRENSLARSGNER